MTRYFPTPASLDRKYLFGVHALLSQTIDQLFAIDVRSTNCQQRLRHFEYVTARVLKLVEEVTTQLAREDNRIPVLRGELMLSKRNYRLMPDPQTLYQTNIHESYYTSSNIAITMAWSGPTKLSMQPRFKQCHIDSIFEKLNRRLTSAQKQHVTDFRKFYFSCSRVNIDRLLKKLQYT